MSLARSALSFVAVSLFFSLAARAASPNEAAAPVAATAIASQTDKAAGGFASERQKDNALLASRLQENLVHFSFHWGRVLAHRGTQELGLGYWGQKAPGSLTASAYGQQQARSYYHYQTSARIFQYSALAVLAADLGYLIAMSNRDVVGGKEEGIFWGLLGGGVILSSVGELLNSAAKSALGRAVQAENTAVINNVMNVQPAKLSLFVAPVHGGARGGAMLQW